MPEFIPSLRTRSTPFSKYVEADTQNAITGYSVYNHMIIPVSFKNTIDDYWHLKKDVQLWDVSVERQVTIKGKDAHKLVQMITPRFIGNMKIKQCFYTPLCDEYGGIINDPIILKLDDDYFNISIADSDVLLWVKGLAYGCGLNVNIFEPDISPLAIQGPKADNVMVKIFGDTITQLNFFHFDYFYYKKHPFLIARSGWSKQGGFEIYFDKPELAQDLWYDIMEVGSEFNIRQGCPHLIERVESGLLSYGNDITLANNPFEVRLDKYVNLDKADGAISKQALMDIREKGIHQRLEAIIIDSDTELPSMRFAWDIKNKNNEKAGYVTSFCFSPALKKYIALSMIKTKHSERHLKGSLKYPLHIELEDGQKQAEITGYPFELPK